LNIKIIQLSQSKEKGDQGGGEEKVIDREKVQLMALMRLVTSQKTGFRIIRVLRKDAMLANNPMLT